MAETRILSELNASVWKLLAAPGEAVERDQELLILESMKTEIPVTAPASGRVAKLLVAESQTVEEGQLLIVLET